MMIRLPLRVFFLGVPGLKLPFGSSIRERLATRFNLADAIRTQTEQQFLNQFPLPLKPLLNFEGTVRNEPQRGILFSLNDYLELVDYTGRVINPDKRGYIPEGTPPILDRLGLSPDDWLQEASEFEALYTQNLREEQGRRRRAA